MVKVTPTGKKRAIANSINNDVDIIQYNMSLYFDESGKMENDYFIIKELNSRILLPSDSQDISGWVHISTGQFRGDNAQFTISFGGDVESMTIKREIHRSYSWLSPGTKTIQLSGQTSPIHVTYALDLGIGDNYIPITVKDKRGNVTEYSYHIEMVQVEKTNPEINIDNNIDIVFLVFI